MDKCTGVSTAWLLIAVLGVLCNVSVPGVLAENPPGTFFVNCGSTASYVDKVTGITWMPDDQFIDKSSGVNANVANASQYYYPDFSEFTTLRYFNDSRAKNCYSFPVTPNETYQIRGTFFYGNYDNQTTVPSFQMGVDGTIVASNIISELYVIAYQEITYVPQRNVTSLCLSRDLTNSVPFISAISLVNVTAPAPFADNIYMGYYYVTQFRWNFGGNGIIRYPADIVDHYWFPIKSNSSYVQSTAQVEALTATGIVNTTFPPKAVLNTALTTNGTMTINIPFTHAYYWFMTLYMAELDPNAGNSSREFYLGVPGYSHTWFVNPLVDGGGLGGAEGKEYYGTVPNYISLFKNQSISTALGPLVNALEIFELSQNQSAILTNEQDTLAIEEIKSSYGNLGIWTGDPCLPYPHPWVTCSNISILQNSSSIIAVNLSGYGLTGPISPSFGKLRSLTSLALDNNELNGLLPNFSQFPNLNTLNLSSNQFNGPIPPSIWDIPKLNVLDLSNNNLSGNLVPNTSTSCPMSLITLNLGNNSLSGSFPSNLLDCSNSTLQEINFDHNNFSGTLNMITWDQVYLIYGVFISMVYNDISTLDPSWEDDTKTYSPILLGGNPICKNLQLNFDFEISYHQQLNCRYNNTVLRSIETVPSNSQRTLREIQQEFSKQQVQPTLYSYNVLSRATRDFHQDNKLGEGGFGVVYKGILLDGTKVAVKLLTTKSHQGIDDFLNEVVSITGVRHKNLVKLKGCCLHRTQRLLVYEYVENKNLAEALWEMEDNIFLDWPTRFHIFVGIARGLVYLHEDLQPCIIHRDIKAANILLDNNLNAKIADFGLARLFSDDQSQLFTQVAGTIGYMSPEYATLGQLSTKVDVYSFGILLLEMISGRKAILQNAATNMYLVEWAWSLHKTNMLISLVDQKLHNTIVESEIRRVINVALLCVQVETTKRPIMSEVLSMLQVDSLPRPEWPLKENTVHFCDPFFQYKLFIRTLLILESRALLASLPSLLPSWQKEPLPPPAAAAFNKRRQTETLASCLTLHACLPASRRRPLSKRSSVDANLPKLSLRLYLGTSVAVTLLPWLKSLERFRNLSSCSDCCALISGDLFVAASFYSLLVCVVPESSYFGHQMFKWATNGIVNAPFPPEAVMNTALTTNGTMTINIPFTHAYIWFMTLYMAELDPNAGNSSREFYVGVPGYSPTWFVNPLVDEGGLDGYVDIDYHGEVPNYISLFKNQSISTPLGPLVNALEIFELSQNQSAMLTNEQDTLAIEEIKSSYGNLGVWTGDPCLPYPHPWVTCSNVSILQNSSSIIAVNLSGYGLTGPISPSFGKLRSLTSLALDNNELNGLLPNFSQFPNLNTLNLSSNRFSGPIPPSIWDIPKLNVLDLSKNNLSDNLVPNTSTPCPMSLIILNLGNNSLNGSFPSNLLDCSNSTLQEINFDHNNFSGTLNMTTWDQVYLIHGVFISMVYNDISKLDPSWEDDTKTYSPILLGGNPICKNLQLSLDFEISYHQQLNCRDNNTVLRSIETVTSNSQRSNNKLILILSTTLSIILVFGGIIGVIILWKYRANALALREIQQEFAKQQVQPTLYSYNVLSRATGDFHQDNKLGEGGFGVVYKGILLDGTKVAVKLLTTKSHQGIDDFLNEVVSITGVRHKNLVKLKGCCLHRTQRLLVYEYVENKNLAEALWGSKMEDNIFLDWPKRFHIFVGIARGLVYLHEDLQPCIIHRDIKASNILLDNNLNAKIADFGLARLFSDDQSQLFTQVAGTIGYMSPEYATLGQLSTKVDVYSFGILLLEIISGRKAILQNATTNMYLVEWAWSLHKTNMLISLVDQKLHNTIVESEMRHAINVALLCVQVETTKRPIMSEVLSMLQGEMDLPNILPSSSQISVSSLFLNVSTSESNHLLSSPIPNNYSNAEVELTNLDPR
ncbi:unnamed protein product [Sphagnum jensenii]|uniref:non-specific serine/threonine protein kinase n=1 Tax=Sphagnum jensenii TaxID=128206 RepID=A0ABP0W8N0_9BRYO